MLRIVAETQRVKAIAKPKSWVPFIRLFLFIQWKSLGPKTTLCVPLYVQKRETFFKMPHKKECQVWNDVRLGELIPSRKNNAITTFTVCQLDACLHSISFPNQSKKNERLQKEEAPFVVCCDGMSRFPWGMQSPIPFSPDRKPEHFSNMSPSLVCLTSHSNVSVSRPLSSVLPYFMPHFWKTGEQLRHTAQHFDLSEPACAFLTKENTPELAPFCHSVEQ